MVEFSPNCPRPSSVVPLTPTEVTPVALLSLLILPACASNLTAWQATGGSRADGSK